MEVDVCQKRGDDSPLRSAGVGVTEHSPLLGGPLLARGPLHLTAIAKLAPHLTLENREAILERAAHKSRREIEGSWRSFRPVRMLRR